MIKLVLFIPVLVSSLTLVAQSENEVISEPYRSITRVDTNVCVQLDKKRKKILWNGKQVDSTGLFISAEVVDKKSLVIFSNQAGKNSFHRINFDGQVKFINKLDGYVFPTPENFFMVKQIHLKKGDERITHFYERNFYKLDLTTAKLSTFFDVDKISGLDSMAGEDLHSVYELPNNKLIATLSYCAYGGCSAFQYYLFDTATGEGTRLDLHIKEPDNEYYHIKFIEHDGEHHLVHVDNYGGRKENGGSFIYDKNFKEISRALTHETMTVGSNYKNGTHLSNNIRSKLDDGNDVIIRYKFSMPLERTLFRIYNNEEVLSDDLKKLSKHQLEIAKNMVFAKHNYRFQSKFYQAYFNYYEFYNSEEKMQSRITDVNRLLTDTDKKNIEAIKRIKQ